MFSKVLVANRGEIAVRAFRAAYEVGAATVAVFPWEDRWSEHRLKADEAFEIGEEFWVDNNPFTLGTPPPAAQSLGICEFEFQALTEERLDELVAEGKAIDHDAERHGALNPGKAWCHRCGTTEGIDESTDRWLGNVTLLCPACAEKEAELAAV